MNLIAANFEFWHDKIRGLIEICWFHGFETNSEMNIVLLQIGLGEYLGGGEYIESRESGRIVSKC